jgi:hypothetical protein
MQQTQNYSSSQVDRTSTGPVMATRRLSIAPCERRVQQAIEYLDELKRSSPENYHHYLGRLALSDYWIYLRVLLGYQFADPWDHGEEMIDFLMENWGHPMLFLVPRGALKTGLLSIPMMPWLLAKDPTLTGIITNVRGDKANKFARLAAQIITSPIYQACFPETTPGTKWGEKGYYLKAQESLEGGTSARIEPSIGAYGVGGNITSAHVRCMIHDDLINEETSTSQIELQKAEAFFIESMNCLDPGGTLMVEATRWRYDDLYGKMESGDLTGHSEPFRVFKRGAERTVMGPNGQPMLEIYNAHRKFFDMRGKEQEIGYTPEFLESRKKSHGSKYYALYQNTPVAVENRILAIENIRLFNRLDRALGPIARIGIECESQGVVFWEVWLTFMRDMNTILPSQKITNPRNMDKAARITGVLQPLLERGGLFIDELHWKRFDGLRREMEEFDKGDDDLLDALAIAISKAPKFIEGKAPMPYIAVDPAFTSERGSNHTGLVVGCWIRDEFFVLHAHKFKTNKPDVICIQILKAYEKFHNHQPVSDIQSRGARCIVSSGNGPRRRMRSSDINWGSGQYFDSLSIGDKLDEIARGTSQNPEIGFGWERKGHQGHAVSGRFRGRS